MSDIEECIKIMNIIDMRYIRNYKIVWLIDIG